MHDTVKTYTLQEVADILKVSRQTLYNHISKGNLHFTKFGKEYRLTESQLEAILQNGFTNTNDN